ncbi:hypothetical protein [Haladaptatus sp. DYF46]|uniref:hypothetical protein n=1 Tax=Haladaptatus sp. DYF46 TaxID=2886041 RepID=UPI001E3A0539|nr:hypothetical protein [Haladaptatus sp. DYF46]
MEQKQKERSNFKSDTGENGSIAESNPKTHVLQMMYSNPLGSEGKDSDSSWSEVVASRIKLSVDDVKNARKQIERIGLIEQTDDEDLPEYILTPEGYQVAHEQEMIRRKSLDDENQTGEAGVSAEYTMLTLLLVFIGVMNIVVKLIIYDISGWMSVFISITLIVLLIVLFKLNNRITDVQQ